jgi:hypothetical protein
MCSSYERFSVLFCSCAEASRAGNVLRILQLELPKALVSVSLNQLRVC